MRLLPSIVLSALCAFSATTAAALAQDTVAPTNALERTLLAVQTGQQPLRRFISELLESQVVLLSKRGVLESNGARDIPALVLPSADGNELLAVFTSPKLAHRVARTYPEYRYGIKTSFLWVLAHTAPGLGLTINPGWTLGLTIPSFGLLQMRDRYQERIAKRLD